MNKLFGFLACASLIVLTTLAAEPAEGRPGGSRGGKGGGKDGKAGGGSSKAVSLLKQAKEIAEKAPHGYDGHRLQAIHSLGHAIKQLEGAGSSHSAAATQSSKGAKGTKGTKGGKGSKGDKHAKGDKHTKGTQSKTGSETQQATQHIDDAIKHMEQAIKFHEGKLEEDRKKGKTPKFVRGGLGEALKLVTEAKKLAQSSSKKK